MNATIIDGRAIAASVRSAVAERVADLTAGGHPVGLATVLVGDDPASQVYVRNKHRAAEGAGMGSFDFHLPADTTETEVIELVERLNTDDRVSGMIVQMPLPEHIDEQKVVAAIDPAKDADGLHPVSLGRLVAGEPGLRPATPSGIMTMLDHHGVVTSGARAVVVGRSFLVGRPLALMLGARGRDATVTMAHSRTKDLPGACAQADILVAAVGVPGLIGRSHIKEGAVVIDVGINRVDGKLVGDVDFDAALERSSAVTPVPGGVGPMTIASLLRNTAEAAELAAGLA